MPFAVWCEAASLTTPTNLTAYDAAFVAAAEMYAVPLATADRRLANAVGPRCSIQLIPR